MLFEFSHFYPANPYRWAKTQHRSRRHLLGDSIGHWDGDALVVDTIGFNDKTWLDRAGHPHSTDLHLVERIRRVDQNTLQDDLTIEDPKAYTKPLGRTADVSVEAHVEHHGDGLRRTTSTLISS